MSVIYDSDMGFSTSKEYDGVIIFNSASPSSGAYMQRTRKLGLDEAVYSKLKEQECKRRRG
jgi:c-di-GMP-binding flagellar brake protein YcgR